MKLNERQIAALEEKGFRRWNTKLERATDVPARYIALNGIRAIQDALNYLAK